MLNALEEWARVDGNGTAPARTLKSDVLAEYEARSREAKLLWAAAGGHDVLSLQHDGIVIALRPGLAASAAERELCLACSAALGYEQPVEAKPMEVADDPGPPPAVCAAQGRVWGGGGVGLGGFLSPQAHTRHATRPHQLRC